MKMTTNTEPCQTTILTPLTSLKAEPMDFGYTSPPAPLDLCVRSKGSPTAPYTNYHISAYTCTSPISSIHSDKQRRTSLGSSPRSNSSAESSELSSMIGDNPLGFASKFGPMIPRTKATRPFKAYPKDPMSLAIGSTAVDIVMGNLGKDSVDSYAEFRSKMLEQVHAQTNNTTNKNMRRNTTQTNQITDPTYWEKRRKNNEAAKRSRDARRAKEDEIAIRCAFLEHEHIRMKHENVQTKHENMQLKFRLAGLEAEIERLQNLIYH